MQKKLKGFYFLVSTLVIAILHMPFAFAKSAKQHFLSYTATPTTAAFAGPTPAPAPAPAVSMVRSVYDSLHLQVSGLSRQAFDYAKAGFDKLVKQGKIINQSVISIVDFSLPSNEKRLYVLDLRNYKVLFNSLVAHGRNTGAQYANSFSNEPSSFKSSPGFYVTEETYNGKHGYSLKLQGLEKGVNDNAYDRAIVLHGASYVSDGFIRARGYIGRSEGCPAVPENMSTPIINSIKGGSCLFIYHPSYAGHSTLVAAI
jgi:hypothetical protein